MIPTSSGDDLAASLDAGLAAVFDEHSVVVIGDAGHHVLRALGNTLNEGSQVSLRASQAEGDDPICQTMVWLTVAEVAQQQANTETMNSLNLLAEMPTACGLLAACV